MMLKSIVARVIDATAVALVAELDVQRRYAQMLQERGIVGPGAQRLKGKVPSRIGGDLRFHLLPIHHVWIMRFWLQRLDTRLCAVTLTDGDMRLWVGDIVRDLIHEMLKIVIASCF